MDSRITARVETITPERAAQLLLRNWMFRATESSRSSVDQTYVLGISIKAWNLMTQGRTARNLNFRMVGQAAEQFPAILVPVQEVA